MDGLVRCALEQAAQQIERRFRERLDAQRDLVRLHVRHEGVESPAIQRLAAPVGVA
jgi:hypothetical protein